MNQFDKKIRQKAAEEKIKAPESVRSQVEATLSALPAQRVKLPLYARIPRAAMAAVCALVLFVVVLPNVSPVYARSMEQIPVLGDLIRVCTIRNYIYQDDTHEMDIQVPNLSTEVDPEAAQRINAEIDQLTKELMIQFYEDLDAFGGEGHGAVYVDYEVVTNTEQWFTLKLRVSLATGSGNTYYEYYHVDRRTGKIVKLEDLFDGDAYRPVIEENIREQMRRQMEEDENVAYFIKMESFGKDFVEVDEDHNFYFNAQGELVIPFDKYEIAPGSMGCPEFTIPTDLIRGEIREEYQEIFRDPQA